MKLSHQFAMVLLAMGSCFSLVKVLERNALYSSIKSMSGPTVHKSVEMDRENYTNNHNTVIQFNKGINLFNFEDAPLRNNRQGFFVSELLRLQLDMNGAEVQNVTDTFDIAHDWIEDRQIYPHFHPQMATILKAMSTAKIIKADGLAHGTQAKLSLYLEGGQRVEFRAKRYERGYVPPGKPNGGSDRHNAEIAAFHLDRILDFRRVPLAVGRIINLKQEILPVATARLRDTFRTKAGNTCYFGVCGVCSTKRIVCADGDLLEGAVTMWLPKEWTPLSYKINLFFFKRSDRKHLAHWQKYKNFCNAVMKRTPAYSKGPSFLDVIDTFVFDYLIGNADRHSFETFSDSGMVVMLDNAKSFVDPNFHEERLLAPIGQCCILRNSTWLKLQQLQDGILTQLLDEAMKNDPIAPVLHKSHYTALNIRLQNIIQTISDCIQEHDHYNVIVKEWKGL